MSALPDPVQQAYDALRAQAWPQALRHVERALTVIEDPPIVARLHGWHAQSLFALGELEPARGAVRQALLAARDLGESDAVAPLKALHGEITAALAAAAAAHARRQDALALAARPLAELLEEATDPRAQAGVYLARADALVDAGRAHEVPALVATGLALAPADATREQVLLRLAHLRIRPPQAADILEEALALASEADSHTLVAACAQAARDLDLALPEPAF